MILTENTEIRFDYNSLKVIGFKNIYGRNSLVFELSMKNGKNVFMRSDCGFRDKQEYILILDLKKLCASTKFKKILDKRVAFDNSESTPPYIKPKILNCLDGFSQGISNPVPLAEISYCLDEVRFINGKTRMSYLVYFCDSSIPIECDIDSVASAGILIGGFFLFRNVFDHISEKWHDRWQYYKVIGVKSLRKAVTVALCIVSITFALIAGMCIPLDINVVSWWICFSIGWNLLYHGCCKNDY